MNPKTLSLLLTEMQRANTEERSARAEYYAYLQSRGDADESLEAHMSKYASLAQFASPASDALLQALQRLSAVPFPKPLLAFYRTLGGFRGGDRLQGLILHAADNLATNSVPNPEQPWDNVPSMGLVDMILWSWGNDRFEFKPESREGLNAAQVATLNRDYSIVGWRPIYDGEGFEYFYFDRDGRFGILRYHQDAFDEIYTEALQPMLLKSEATLTFDEAMAALLASAAKSDWDDEE